MAFDLFQVIIVSALATGILPDHHNTHTTTTIYGVSTRSHSETATALENDEVGNNGSSLTHEETSGNHSHVAHNDSEDDTEKDHHDANMGVNPQHVPDENGTLDTQQHFQNESPADAGGGSSEDDDLQHHPNEGDHGQHSHHNMDNDTQHGQTNHHNHSHIEVNDGTHHGASPDHHAGTVSETQDHGEHPNDGEHPHHGQNERNNHDDHPHEMVSENPHHGEHGNNGEHPHHTPHSHNESSNQDHHPHLNQTISEKSAIGENLHYEMNDQHPYHSENHLHETNHSETNDENPHVANLHNVTINDDHTNDVSTHPAEHLPNEMHDNNHNEKSRQERIVENSTPHENTLHNKDAHHQVHDVYETSTDHPYAGHWSSETPHHDNLTNGEHPRQQTDYGVHEQTTAADHHQPPISLPNNESHAVRLPKTSPMERNHTAHQTPASPKERNDSMQTAEGLVCFSCQGTYEECGRKQMSGGDPVRVCDMGHSCIVGRTGTGEAADEFSMYTSQQKLGQEGDGQDSSYVYFRECFHETCGLEMEELHCMRVGLNVTCQRCCARNHCNADAFNSGTVLSTHPHRFSRSCLGALVLLVAVLAFA